MTATQAILNYAVAQGGPFHKKDLLREVTRQQTGIKGSALTLQISRMITSGLLCRVGRGMYVLAHDSLPEYVYQPSETEKDIYFRLKQKFPFLDFCIWSPRVLASFMLHVPDIGYVFVDVEKDGMDTVFHALQEMELGRNILLSPSPIDCDRYLTGTDSIVVRQLIGQSPLTIVDGCQVPRIEKILVDAIGDNELLFASGTEIYNIYEYARERCHVNMSKLLRYASRRNRKGKVEHIIYTIDHDQSQE